MMLEILLYKLTNKNKLYIIYSQSWSLVNIACPKTLQVQKCMF